METASYEIRIPKSNGKEVTLRVVRVDPHGFLKIKPIHANQNIPPELEGSFTSLEQITKLAAVYVSRLPDDEEDKETPQISVEPASAKKRFKKRDPE